MAMFIYNEGDGIYYERKQILPRRLKELGVTTNKKASTESYQEAYTSHHHILHEKLFWTSPLSFDVVGIPRFQKIN